LRLRLQDHEWWPHPFAEDIKRGNGDIEIKALNEEAEKAEKKRKADEKKGARASKPTVEGDEGL
jgi:hypothetical protein